MRRVTINLNRPQPLQQIASGSTTPFSTFSNVMDPAGNLKFAGKASIGTKGIEFDNGTVYAIKLDDFQLIQMLGRGQFGIVQKVVHKPTQVIMAIKEVRLELDQHKLNQIIMELEILHKSRSPFIIDFFGAFVVESCVYISIEYMDAGSLDKLCKGGIPEPVLAKIAIAMIKGLEYLKKELNVIHRDVKPTNVLANTQGKIKLCDFGVSGQLIQSMAKTNVGCQPYMSPERITHSGDKYSSRADVWSLGLSLVEMGLGYYPFRHVINDSVFAQLNAVVSGPIPMFPETFTTSAHSFISKCLSKDPLLRPTYEDLLQLEWIQSNEYEHVDLSEWVKQAISNKNN